MSTSTEVVTSVGNSWIICRSNTYAGRIYYFNTMTGEAAWNLSETEIEKAKKRTSIIASQTGFQIDNCPEPKDSPRDLSNQIPSHSNKQKIPSRKMVPSKVYNKQIINNQFPRPNFPYTTPFNSLSSINPMQYSMVVNPTVNPSMWNFNPQPIFVTPNVINQQPVINTTFNNNDYVPVTNTSVPLSSRFKIFNENQRRNRVNKGSFRGRKNNFRNRFNNARNSMDLRLLLSSKKRKPNNLNEAEDFQQELSDVKSSNNINSKDKRTPFHQLISCDDVDDDIWFEENQNRSQSFKDSIDISPLRKFLQMENSFDIWYIVLDSNVLLNNITFLEILLNSDKQCRLMVPQAVMNKIEMATKSSLRTQAYGAAYFVLQKVDANIAVIGTENQQESNDDRAAILNCCTILTDQGYPVVLLTDDIEFHNLEGNTQYQVLTVNQVKNILSKTVSNAPKSNSLEDLTLSRSIVITIPNDVNKPSLNHVKENICKDAMAYPTEKYSKAINIPEDSASDNIVETNEMLKNNNSIGVQTNTINLLQNANDKRIGTSSSNNDEKMLNKNTRPTLNRTLSNGFNTKPDTEKQKLRGHKLRTKSISNLNKVNDNELTKSDNISEESHLPNCNSDRDFLVQNSFDDNSIIEKTSTGKSNTSNNVKMDNTQVENKTNNLVKVNCLPENTEIEDKNVMFEVTSSDMEECLSRKCDEFISRFVQIIEEASTQVLQQDPPFVLDTMPPPWTIYEATECIKRKFHNDNDIVDAANKLLNVLFVIGGLRGKMTIDISPQKYMEMYSYGVYLIDALQGLLNNSEDLQIAAESLSKLLSDIENTNVNSDSRFEDSYTDILPETENNVTQEKSSNEEAITELVNPVQDKMATKSECKIVTFTNKSPEKKAKTESNISSHGSYTLRSSNKKLLQEKEEFSDKMKVIQNIDPESSFFMSLRLKRNENTNSDLDVNKPFDGDVNIEDRDNFETVNTENVCESVSKTNENVDTYNSKQENNFANEPKVIRNFTLCPEIENKLKEKKIAYDSWISKNSAYRNEMVSEETEEFDYESMENEYYGCDYEMYDAEDISELNSSDRCTENEESVISAEKTYIHFKDIIGKIEHNIRESFSLVHRFCEKCYTTLRSNERNNKKQEMQHIAEDTYLYLSNLCDALNSILSRESSDSAYRIQELLKLEELGEIVLEDDDLEGYRTFVTKCIEQGNVLKDSVQLVIDASRE